MGIVHELLAPSRRQFAASLLATWLATNPALARAGDETSPKLALSWWTTPEAYGCVGDGVSEDRLAFQDAIEALRRGQTLVCNGNYRLNGGLRLADKSNIRITGTGRLFFDAAPGSSIMFELIGRISDLEIDTLTLEGDGLARGHQGGIGCASGQTISATHFHGLKIRRLNVGISHNADLSGSWRGSRVHDNWLTDICGTESGSGYGIHAARATDVHVYNNELDNCSRHAIYIGKGYDIDVVVRGNKIRNHRKDVFEKTYRAAISCSRVSGVLIAQNIVRDGYDCALEIAHETSSHSQCYNVLVVDNKFINRKNSVPYIVIGEPAIPTIFLTREIVFRGNKFYDDASITTATVINLFNGKRILVEDNDLYVSNASNALPIFMELGNSRVANDRDVSGITVRNNRGHANVSVENAAFLYLDKYLCEGSQRYRATANSAPKWGRQYRFEKSNACWQSPPKNKNSKS